MDQTIDLPKVEWSPGEADQLLNWFGIYKRDLPWRRLQGDPYAVWISEIMLQQTQVATVIAYFNRWMERFPTVDVLASSPIEDVLRQWEGLGYYARARNIHRAANEIVEGFGGKVPSNADDLGSLPGIGPYTQGAILSIAFNQRVPIVDTNVERVLSRRFCIDGDPKSPSVKASIWRFAEAILPDHSAREFNSALMELGALVCRPVDPSCAVCPMMANCCAAKTGNPSAWPMLAPSKRTVRVQQACVAIQDNGKWLMTRRPLNGLWGGLWEFPRTEVLSGETPESAAIRAAHEITEVSVELIDEPFVVKHAVMHYGIELSGWIGHLSGGNKSINANIEHRWVSFQEMQELPLTSPQRKLSDKIYKRIKSS
ncbi:MAG: A/G-specific adenine glycosylase [Chthonomonadales bacterium]